MSEKLTDRDLLASQPADGDLFHVVDISDTTDSPEGTSKKIAYSSLVPDASTTVEGKVELATDAETITGADTARAMTPSNLTAKIDTDGTLAGNSDTRIPSQKAVKTYVTNNGFNGANFFPQRGFLLNGKFTVTDSGSGIVVAIKTAAGTDPTASDIVYVRIGDTTRQITSALSRSLADGTNWFNAGSSELATKEIDYFVYLVWDSNSSAVGLSYARIPSANLVSDFSATTTDEKYCAGYSDFTSTDEVEVIGRFAATLSAGAGYTWSVPTYTASNLIQRPIYESRWNQAKSVLAGFSAITSETIAYKVIGNTVFIESIGNLGGTSNATTFTLTLPFKAGSTVGTKNLMSSNGGDSGSTLSAPSFLGITSGSASVTVGKTMANTSGGGFTASSTKWVTLSGMVIQI